MMYDAAASNSLQQVQRFHHALQQVCAATDPPTADRAGKLLLHMGRTTILGEVKTAERIVYWLQNRTDRLWPESVLTYLRLLKHYAPALGEDVAWRTELVHLANSLGPSAFRDESGKL